MCRFSMTILDELNYSKYHDYKDNKYIIDYLYSLTIGENNIKFNELEDNFDMYVSIAKYANNSLPIDIIQNDIFISFRIKKKHFPRSLYYHL